MKLLKALSVLFCLNSVCLAQEEVVALDTPVQDLVQLINFERAKVRSAPLTFTNELTCAAQTQAVDMGTKQFCATNASDGTSPWERPKKCGTVAYGMLIGCGYLTPQDAAAGWVTRQDTATLLLDPKFRTVGAAMFNNYWVVYFSL